MVEKQDDPLIVKILFKSLDCVKEWGYEITKTISHFTSRSIYIFANQKHHVSLCNKNILVKFQLKDLDPDKTNV